jgi:rRNA processing protein Gar1
VINLKNSKNYRMSILLTNQKGMALLTTLIFVSVLVTLAVALLTMTNNDSKMSTKLNTAVVDGGEDINDWRPTNYPVPGTATEYYQVTIVNDGVDDDGDPKVKITSRGTVIDGKFSSGKRIIEVKAEIDRPTEKMYDYAILSDKIILFQGTPGPDIVGNVHSNDDILVSGHFGDTYTGTATSSGETNDLDDNGNNTGIPEKTIPTVDYGLLLERATAAGNVIEGNKSLGNAESWGTVDNPLTGIHYIKGDLNADNGSEIYVSGGAIIVEGDVNIKYGATFEIDNDNTYIDPDDPLTALALVAQGNIKIYAEAEIGVGVVQSILADGKTPEGFIELKNGCQVTGSVIADTVYLRNKTSVIYPPSGLNEFTKKGDPFFKKTSWREVY